MKAGIQTFKTPFGDLFVVSTFTDQPMVIGAGFGRKSDLLSRISHDRSELEISKNSNSNSISTAVSDWLDGDLSAFDLLVTEQIGSSFRQQCWKAMRKIPPAKTISYAQLASKTKSPNAVRAAATACAQNLIAPIIPCHRIVRSDGSLGRYGYGELTKHKLLEFEKRFL